MPKKKSSPTSKRRSSLEPLPQLSEEPTPSIRSLRQVADRILSGDIQLPKFQRGFVWNRSKILDLLESIVKGYPIGSILLWQSRTDLRSERRIADLDVEFPHPGYPVNYLLDGQQRLSVICGALYWSEAGNPDDRWNIAYDLMEETFIFLNTLDDPPIHQVRTNKMSDHLKFAKHLASLELLPEGKSEKLRQRLENVFRRFQEYKIAVVTLGDMPVTEVAPIFERINSKVTPLTIVDLMRAATWRPDFDLIDAIDEILEGVADKGFDNTDPLVILRNISAAACGGFPSAIITTLRDRTTPELYKAVDEVKEAYKRTVDFLSTQIGIVGTEVVPYANQMTILTEVFRQIPLPSSDQYSAMFEWFWRTSESDYFRGWNTGAMASDLDAIKDLAEGKNSKLIVHTSKPEKNLWQYRTFGRGNALSKAFAITLAHHQPVDLLTGVKIDTATALAWNNTKEYHHIFPQNYLKQKGEKTTLINCLANYIMLTSASNKTISDKAPSEYFQLVSEAAESVGANLDSWLSSNLISQDAYQAAVSNNFDKFIEFRSQTLHEATMKNANWD
jgi:hypothetical protein